MRAVFHVNKDSTKDAIQFRHHMSYECHIDQDDKLETFLQANKNEYHKQMIVPMFGGNKAFHINLISFCTNIWFEYYSLNIKMKLNFNKNSQKSMILRKHTRLSDILNKLKLAPAMITRMKNSDGCLKINIVSIPTVLDDFFAIRLKSCVIDSFINGNASANISNIDSNYHKMNFGVSSLKSIMTPHQQNVYVTMRQNISTIVHNHFYNKKQKLPTKYLNSLFDEKIAFNLLKQTWNSTINNNETSYHTNKIQHFAYMTQIKYFEYFSACSSPKTHMNDQIMEYDDWVHPRLLKKNNNYITIAMQEFVESCISSFDTLSFERKPFIFRLIDNNKLNHTIDWIYQIAVLMLHSCVVPNQQFLQGSMTPCVILTFLEFLID